MLNKSEIQKWLVIHISEQLSIAPKSIDLRQPFANYGLSSLDAVALSGDLEELLGRRLSPTLAYDYPNILTLSMFLAETPEAVKPGLEKTSVKDAGSEPIAVIGMGCRFPGANNPESYWKLLCDGIDAIREVPSDRWSKMSFYNPDPSVPGKSISRWGGFLDNIDQFDPFFFGISPIEAEYMDPQQRLLLELSSEALDDAGQVGKRLDGANAGVFIGISVNEYAQHQFGNPKKITGHAATGSALSIAANRISYYFNFKGPSIAIDTACSSSLTALHLACKSLRSGECDLALAGGVNLILSPAHSIAFTKAGVLAPDGRCKSFDARANGYVRGEGGGVVVLKPLSSAMKDGDPVHGVIIGSAMYQDGRTNGLISPNSEAQEELLRATYRIAGIPSNGVQYVEAHGTGTLLGDSMEAKALGAVIGADRVNETCAIGSVKTNIGHLEAAAGIAGLIKVILSLKNRIIPPSLHYQTPNPHVPFDKLNIKVQDALAPWPTCEGPRQAGVSSFGFGGTNVHMIVRESSQEWEGEEEGNDPEPTTSNCHLLPLSAKSGEALKTLVGSFKEFLITDTTSTIGDLCFASSMRRSHHDFRIAAIGHSKKELLENLDEFLEEEDKAGFVLGQEVLDSKQKLVFVFSGQGGQWLGMGQNLLHQEPVFCAAIEEIDQIIQSQFNWSLIKELNAEPEDSKIDEISIIQPVLFAIQVALVRLWQSWGISPDAVVGHSMGEVAAALIAGILSLEDAIHVICSRSKLLLPFRGQGSMLVTELSLDQAEKLLKGYDEKIAIAVINSPNSTVLSGDSEAVKVVMETLEAQNIYCKLVNVDVASHSPQMDSLRTELLASLGGIKPQFPGMPIYSTVTGNREDNLIFDAVYWIDNLRKTTLFSAAIEKLFDDGYATFVEISPHPVLLGAIQQTLQHQNQQIRVFPSLRREEPEQEILYRTLGSLYIEGFSIDWEKLYPNGAKYVKIPPIPWERQRYWIETEPSNIQNPWGWVQKASNNLHPFLGDFVNLADNPSSFVWQTIIDDESLTILEDHKVDNEIIFPAAAYIEMALHAAEEIGLKNSILLSDFLIKESLILTTVKPRLIQSHLSPGENGNFLFNIYCRDEPAEDWTLHASATIIQHQKNQEQAALNAISPTEICNRSTGQLSANDFYKSLKFRGVDYGPGFRHVEQIWSNDHETIGQIKMHETLQKDHHAFLIHPALLDSCLQVLGAKLGSSTGNEMFLPTGCKSIQFFASPDQIRWSYASLQTEIESGSDVIEADIRLLDNQGQTIALFSGFSLQRTSRHVRHLLDRQNNWLYQLKWQFIDIPSVPARDTESKNWVIFADHKGFGELLAKHLEESGDYCKVVHAEEIIKRLEIEPNGSLFEFIENLLKEISFPIYGIVHLWSISIPSPSLSSFKTIDIVDHLGCNSILYLVQVLANRLAGMPRLWLVSQGAQSVDGHESIAIEQSTLWGFGKVLSFEFPELKCTRVDLDPKQSVTDAVPDLIQQLSIDDSEDQVAYRTGSRFVLRVLPFARSMKKKSSVTLRTDGIYLITGGLGGLGLAVAQWMTQRGARHIILLGRSEPSPTAMDVVDRLQRKGIEVVVAQGDVSDPTDLERVFSTIEKKELVLRGIIHAAGVLDDGSILNLNEERMKKVFSPKVEGTWNLHEKTLDLSLDFFVLFSSAVSVLGSPGQGNYAAASAYLDAMAHLRHNRGIPAISINWGPWADVGLAAETLERLKDKNASTQHIIKVIKIDEGLEILEELLMEKIPQIMVLPFDLTNLIELYPAAAGMPFLEAVGGSGTHVAQLYARPNLRQKYVAPRNEIEKKLVELWRQTLHIDRVGIKDSFFELGGDSVLAAQILSMAQKTFGIRINPQEAFKAFTIERLGTMLESEILNQIEEMSEEEAERILTNRNRDD